MIPTRTRLLATAILVSAVFLALISFCANTTCVITIIFDQTNLPIR
jgi:hypothetical protein